MTVHRSLFRRSCHYSILLAVLLITAACSSSSSGIAASTTTRPSPSDVSPVAFEIAALPDDLAPLAAVFTKHVDVFGVDVVATSTTEDQKVLHAANVMAQYLDNNADGVPDNPTVIETMVSNEAILLMAATEQEAANLDESVFATVGDGGQDLYGSETDPAVGFDAALEEIHHLIYRQGWMPVFPDQLSDQKGSALADAMDLARGGRFETIPATYPDGAWYTYDDPTCDYSECQIDEYFYWAHTSLLGGQQGRGEEIGNEWQLETPEKVRTGDPAVTAILEDAALGLPTILPDGNYTVGNDAETTSGADATSVFDDCLTDSPDGTVPEDLSTVGEIVETTEYPGFSKTLTVYGLTLVAQAEVDDGFLRAVAQVVVEMFPSDVPDLDTQAEVISSLYRYKALIPVPVGEDIDPAAVEDWDGSVCDAIFYGVPGQVMEVVEHLVHYVSDIGLHTALPDRWQLSDRSDLHASMLAASESGHYGTSSYLEIPSPVRERVLLQEYAYWIITSHWDLQAPYGPGEDEWTATTPDLLEQEVPSAHTLVVDTISQLMAPPSSATLDALTPFEISAGETPVDE